MEVVESGSKNIEVAVMRYDKTISGGSRLEVLPEEEVEALCKQIEEEKAALAAAAAGPQSAISS